MKKLGIVLFALGVIIMGVAAYDFVGKRQSGPEERVEGEALPIPWKPTSAAVLMAVGIILMSKRPRRIV